jgi:hypothetical protein
MISCRKNRAIINLYLDGEADVHQKELLFSHIEVCESCNVKLEESKKFHDLITSVATINSPSNLSRLIALRLRDEDKEKKLLAFPLLAWTGITAIILVILFSAMWHNNQKTIIPTNIQTAKAEIQIVSPREDSVVEQQSMDISAALISNDSVNVHVILDGKDVTDATEISKDFLVYTPDALKEGYHKVFIQAVNDNGTYITHRSWEFFVIASEKTSTSSKTLKIS